MRRRAAGWLALLVCLLPLRGFAQEPSFGFRFVETRDKRVRVTSVDPKGLAWQMGLRDGDIFRSVNKQAIRSRKDLVDAFHAIHKKYAGAYEIVVTRGGRSRTLKGKVVPSPTVEGRFERAK